MASKVFQIDRGANEWRQIADAPDYVSSRDGRVAKAYKGTIRELKVRLSGAAGYLQVEVAGRKMYVHRIVAETWIRPPLAGEVCNHLDGRKWNNHASNLEWCTPSDNLKHAYDIGLRDAPFSGKFGSSHNTSKAVISRCLISGAEVRYGAAMDAVREGFSSSGISRACRGIIASHGGRSWRFE